MKTIPYHRHRFHPDIIKQAIWLYFRFTMSYRDVEELLAERGIDVSYETVCRWALKFGKEYAKRIKKRRPQPQLKLLHLEKIKVTNPFFFMFRLKLVSIFLSEISGNTQSASRY